MVSINPDFELDSLEVYWREHYDWLWQCGYMLRPRYQPDWIPSWKGTKKSPHSCEDAQRAVRPIIMDATRTSDKEVVLMKRIDKAVHPFELEIAQNDFLQKYSNLTFMEPLVESMVSADPSSRPTMSEAVETLQAVLAKLTRWQLRGHLVQREDEGIVGVLKDLHYLCFRLVPHLLLRIPPMPTPTA